ncbi:MAG TPA: hypothetical protein VFO83_06995, partial [Aggregicoccus sp.]|nr:hypothetical protein [Aggregicoccus sp.]
MTPQLRRIALVSLALVLGAAQRIHAVRTLPPDFDEVIYLPVAYDYAERIPGRLGELPSYPENREHPPFVKLTYALAVDAFDPPEPDWETLRVGTPLPEDAKPAFGAGRWVSAAAGLLQLALLAVVSPLASLILALEPYHAKYTSQAMLEAIPGVFALLAVLLVEAALRREGRARALRIALAAAALGASAACKYPYGIVMGLTLLPFVIRAFPRRPAAWAGFVGAALLALVAFDPTFWPNPLARASEAIGFHWGYAHSKHVVESALPWWAQIRWLLEAAPLEWHRGVFATGLTAKLLLPVAVIGFPVAWRERRIFAVWAVVGLVFLLLWPT